MIPLFSSSLANAGIDFLAPLKRVLDSSWYVLGSEVRDFEAEFATYVGVDHCVSLGNGTDALELALRGLEIEPGDQVVAVGNAGFYGSTAIHAVGAVPLYVDVDAGSLTLSPQALAEVLQRQKPAAIIVTHLYGQLAAIEEIIRLASVAGVPVIEDCAQAHGARRNGQMAGSFGTIACFSFYPTKNLGALGDGGAVVTNDAQLAARVRQLRQYGWSTKYRVALQGGCNSRLDEMQAAILRAKLPHLDAWNSLRRVIATRYNQAFSSLDVKLPCSLGEDYVAHLYVLRVKNRAAFSACLRQKQVATDIHYPIPDHRQAAYQPSAPSLTLPVTESACETVISLPCFPGLADEDVEKVIEAVLAYFNGEA
ncbi:erythromycin biosynthesis sensory transduction protein eryC1 [Pusillimonas sp. TS35]|nr:erythromycin biosynthesis sensory transduction protein eryC1 [Pusillimonas sp. TS35]